MKLFAKAHWRPYCKACGWVGKARRNNLRALEDCHSHWCDTIDKGRPVRVPSYDKGIQRDDG